jgi:Tat protein secretion system quality control protein TatD with DNase activity
MAGASMTVSGCSLLEHPISRARLGPDDMQYMLARAKNAGLRSMIITGGSLKESKAALKLAGELGRPLTFLY